MTTNPEASELELDEEDDELAPPSAEAAELWASLGATGQFRRVEATFISTVGHRCHLPTM